MWTVKRIDSEFSNMELELIDFDKTKLANFNPASQCNKYTWETETETQSYVLRLSVNKVNSPTRKFYYFTDARELIQPTGFFHS